MCNMATFSFAGRRRGLVAFKDLQQNFICMVLVLLLPLGAMASETGQSKAQSHETSEIVTQSLDYHVGEQVFNGYLAQPAVAPSALPAVLVVHEWWGHNDYARSRAEALAKLGFVAFAVDMYGEGKVADHPQQAGAFSSKIAKDFPLAKARFEAALKTVNDLPKVQAGNVAAIGYCFGGSTVLAMAEAGLPLKGVVSFHGGLGYPVPERIADSVAVPMLVLHGGADALVPSEAVTAFKTRMDKNEVDYEFVSYAGAPHSFTNPQADEFAKRFSIPVGYDAQADAASWIQMQAFLARVLD